MEHDPLSLGKSFLGSDLQSEPQRFPEKEKGKSSIYKIYVSNSNWKREIANLFLLCSL